MDEFGRSDLHYAALRNNASAIDQLLASGESINAQDLNGFTPLHFAAQEYAVEALAALLGGGAQVDVVNKFGNTPLWVAAMNSRGRGEAIRLLRMHGANPYHENRYGKSPVEVARSIGNYDNAQFFADLPARDPD